MEDIRRYTEYLHNMFSHNGRNGIEMQGSIMSAHQNIEIFSHIIRRNEILILNDIAPNFSVQQYQIIRINARNLQQHIESNVEPVQQSEPRIS